MHHWIPYLLTAMWHSSFALLYKYPNWSGRLWFFLVRAQDKASELALLTKLVKLYSGWLRATACNI